MPSGRWQNSKEQHTWLAKKAFRWSWHYASGRWEISHVEQVQLNFSNEGKFGIVAAASNEVFLLILTFFIFLSS